MSKALPTLVTDPEQLAVLAGLVGMTPAAVQQLIAQVYEQADWAPAQAFAPGGPAKVAFMLKALQQCGELAMEMEARTNSSSHLSHTLEHLQAHLLLLLGGYEVPAAATPTERS